MAVWQGIVISLLISQYRRIIVLLQRFPSFEELRIVSGIPGEVDASSVCIIYDYWRARRKKTCRRQKDRREVRSVLDEFNHLFNFVRFCGNQLILGLIAGKPREFYDSGD